MELVPRTTVIVQGRREINASQFPALDFDIHVPAALEIPSKSTFDPSYNSYYNALNEIYCLSEGSTGGRAKTRKKKLSASTFDALEVHALRLGYSQADLLLIWEVATSQSLVINGKQRVRLIFSMHPNYKVASNVIETIVDWLLSAKSHGFQPTVIKAVYQLLILYLEYDLVERTELFSEHTLTRILTAPTENIVIPWKIQLFCKLVDTGILSKLHLYHLKNMLTSADAKKTQLEDIRVAIRLCKFMRPDLVENDNDEVVRSGSSRSLNIPKEIRDMYFKCRCRIQEHIPPHPMADKVFPEFLPECISSDDYYRKNSFQMMLELMKSTEGLIKLALSPPMLKVFSDWLEVLLNHKFGVSSYSRFDSAEDLSRYGFIIDCCTTIVQARQEGFDVLNNWLVSLLTVWDYQLFQGAVFKLLPFVNPQDVQQVKSQLSQTFINGFADRKDLRKQLWKALSKLVLSWMRKIETTADDPALADVLTWLLDTMRDVVDNLAIAPDFNNDPDLIVKMLSSYETMISMEGKVRNDEVRLNIRTLPQGLVSTVALNGNLDFVETLGHIMQSIRPMETRSMRNAYFLMSGLSSGVLAPSVLNTTDLERKLSACVSPDFRQSLANEGNIPYGQWYNDERTPERPAILGGENSD
ncbi:unnamed protein product [Orchesella dallaii]|uniref:Centromere protein I n=1 Tax=Orchesella dallaii TaxID=48710 RepID=A0ABP1RG64_9HEXA